MERGRSPLSLRTPALINAGEYPRGALALQGELQGEPLSKVPSLSNG